MYTSRKTVCSYPFGKIGFLSYSVLTEYTEIHSILKKKTLMKVLGENLGNNFMTLKKENIP